MTEGFQINPNAREEVFTIEEDYGSPSGRWITKGQGLRESFPDEREARRAASLATSAYYAGKRNAQQEIRNVLGISTADHNQLKLF